MVLASRSRGALLGLAVGDALGAPVEFREPGTFEPVTGMRAWDHPAGTWTDDTSMALCLAESLIERASFDPLDQLRRYVRWWKEGHLSAAGFCFDIGLTTRASLKAFLRTGEPYPGPVDPKTSGNGSLMRLAPIPIACSGDPGAAVAMSGESSRTTHGSSQAVDACRFFGGLMAAALAGAPRSALLAPAFSPVPGLWEREPLDPAVREVAEGSYARREPPEIRGTGHVVRTLEAALWAFSKSTSFAEGALLAVNLGEDADTTGAVYGQLAGAHYGVEGIPGDWIEALRHRDVIEAMADGLSRLTFDDSTKGLRSEW